MSENHAMRANRSLHGSIVDLHNSLRREEAISKGLAYDNVSNRSFNERRQMTWIGKLQQHSGSTFNKQLEFSGDSKQRSLFVNNISGILPISRPATSMGLNLDAEVVPRVSETFSPDYRHLARGRSHVASPAGAKSSHMLELEAVRVFGDSGEITRKIMSGPGKFMEAHTLEISLTEILLKGQQLLGNNPTTETRSKYNFTVLAELFKTLEATAGVAGPFQNLLASLARELKPFVYSLDKSFDQSSQEDVPYIEVVSRLKRDNERISATLVSANAALAKSDRDFAKLTTAKKHLETRIVLLEQQLQHKSSDSKGIEKMYKELQEEYAKLQKNFHDLQRGFMMGELQDDLKESLMADFGSSSDDRAMVEEQSAMQKLVQQLKDAREAMLNSQDDMHYWKSPLDPSGSDSSESGSKSESER